MEKLLDLYTDYLHVTFRDATATGLSRMVDGAVSHDQISRMLSKPAKTSKDLWLSVKSLVRRHENENACLIFTDSITGKPYTDENDLICWHHDHSKNRCVKGLNPLTAFYHSQSSDEDLPLRVPVGFETVQKPLHSCDLVTDVTHVVLKRCQKCYLYRYGKIIRSLYRLSSCNIP